MDETRATAYAVWLLSQQARSEKQVGDRLAQKGCDDATIAAVLERLRGWGYLNDPEFAERWVASRGKMRGRRALAFELRRKGIDPDEALAERTTDDEVAAARAAAARRVGESPTDRSREAQAKLAAFLQRRGFGWDAIRPVLRALYRDDADDDAAAEEPGD
jgi:regulatory protein